LVKELRQWRRETAEAAGFPPFRIFSNATLERLAATRPSSLGQLLLIKGIGPVTVQNYGDQLLAILARHPATRPAVPAPAPPPPPGPSPAEQAPGAIGEAAEPWPASSLPRAADRPRFVESPADVPPAASRLPQSAQESGRPSAPDSPPTWPALRALLPAAALAFEKRQAKPAFYWTWRLLWDGYTAAQCSEIRQLDSAAVLTHALQAQEQGLPGRLDWFLTAAQQQQLAQLVGDGTPHRLRPLLDQLPPGLGYDHVQLYLRCRAPRS
jgi:hypothetical protein